MRSNSARVSSVRRIAPYVLVGAFIWLCVLKSGVHATLAGVALAFAIPLRTGLRSERETHHCAAHQCQHRHRSERHHGTMPTQRIYAINLRLVDDLDWSKIAIEKMDGRNNW